MENSTGQMENIIKVITKMIKNKDMGNFTGRMVKYIKVSGWMDYFMGMVHY